MYSGKSETCSNIAWHRPQSTPCRVDDELMEKSARDLYNTTDPLVKLRLLCLSRGSCGILELGRHFRKMAHNGSKELNKEEFMTAIKHAGLELSHEDAETLFDHLDPHDSGSINVDDFIRQVRPPMNDGRRAIVERAFQKLDKAGAGVIATGDLRAHYCCDDNPRYKSGEEYEELIVGKFLANFEKEGTVDGHITLEEFMNYYSAISVSMDNDCYFDLVMRQAYKL